MNKVVAFGFVAKLKKTNNITGRGYFIAPFKVAATTHDEAKEKLLKYLSNPKQTGLNYECCIELIDSSCDIILVDD